MPEAIFTIGISASGKTTWAHQQHAIVLDSDQLRLELYNSETEQHDPHKVFDLMYKRGREQLLNGNSVVFCSTNLSMKYRMHAIRQLSNIPNIKFRAVIFNVPVNICQENNKKRARQVPDWLFERQIKQFQCPVKTEGFDTIEIITPFQYNGIEFSHSMWNDVRAIGSQDNPHHTLTLYDHLQACIDNLNLSKLPIDDEDSKNLYIAVALHDVGKAYTRSYDENGIAHYYSHEGYSAYVTMNMRCNLEVIQLVCYHMKPYDTKGASIWEKRLGEELWKKILILHDADERSH